MLQSRYFHLGYSFTHTTSRVTLLHTRFWCDTNHFEIVLVPHSQEVHLLYPRVQRRLSSSDVVKGWKLDSRDLPDHKLMCLNRLKSLLQRLQKNKVVLKEYAKTIQEQLDKGIIEKVPNVSEANNPVHYLPHLPVVRTGRSTTKVRVVYDGSAKSNESSLSLNDCLHKGPNLIPKLFDALIRFRNHPVALTGDIEKAF